MNNLNKDSNLETKWLDGMDSVACIHKSILYLKKYLPSITDGEKENNYCLNIGNRI